MSVWREVQEAALSWWLTRWASAPAGPEGAFLDEKFDPPNGPWYRLLVEQRPAGPGTLGSPGNRRMDRSGAVFALLRQPPGGDSGALSDLAEKARDVFENCRLAPHDIRFGAVQIGQEATIEEGRWRGVTVEARFDYEQIK